MNTSQITAVDDTADDIVHEALSPDAILGLGFGFWGSKTLLSAIELGVFGALADGPLGAEDLRTAVGIHPRSALDFFDALVALGMLRRDDAGYSNTPETGLFLDPAKPSYVGGILEMSNERLYGFWNSLTEGLRTSEPQNEVKSGGRNYFADIYAEPGPLHSFLTGMSGISIGASAALADAFPWDSYQRFCDLGTAQGMAPAKIAQRHPHLAGIGFDLPPVGPVFEEFIEAQGLAGRVSFAGGDFFTDPLPEADVYLMGHILHNWSLPEKQALLRRVHDALPDGGALIVYDALIDDERRSNTFGLLMSLNMLIETPAGVGYTGADCRAWMSAAGFRDSYVKPLAGPDFMVVGLK
jgi:O-methyltransferase domain/Dimerisation domain